MSKPRITGTRSSSASFKVSFPDGLGGEPSIEVDGLNIDADGEGFIYGALLACSNWLESHVAEMKSRPQVSYNIADIEGKSVTLKKGKVLHND